MPPALQVVNFFKQGLTGGAFEALTPGTGDSDTFQDFTPGTPAFLADVRGVDDAHACELSLIASRFHDQIEGIAGWVPSGAGTTPVNRPQLITPPGYMQPIYPSDVLSVRALGTAKDNVNASVVLYYQDLPGISAQLRTARAVKGATINLVGVDVTVDPSSLAQGDWSTGVSLSAGGRRLDAGKYYAVLGITSPVALAAVGLSAFETGNIKVGGPALGDAEHDASLFTDLAEYFDMPLIPMIAGNNQDNVLLFAADPAAGSTDITVMLAELSGKIA
jgi:hypothetical protein